MGVIFGGGSQSVFGSTGAGGLLVKLTAIFGAVFLITSLGYNALSGKERRPAASSIMLQEGAPAVPAAPGGATADKPAEAGKLPGVTFEETTKPGASILPITPPVDQAAKPAASAATPQAQPESAAPTGEKKP